MGCFVSTNKSTPPTQFTKSARTPPQPPPRSPPPPHPLEETVKEVLSETPKLKPNIPKILPHPEKVAALATNIQENEERHEIHLKNKPKMVNYEEISEISEIYSSLSESFSTITEKRDNEEDGYVRQRVDRSPEKFKRRSFSGDFNGKKERGVPKSPARRPEQPSPNRVKPVPGRERAGAVTDEKEMRKNKDTGESSRRRSRSPVIRADSGGTKQNLGRSPSARKTGKSPGRVKSDLAEKSRKVDGVNREGKWPPTSNELLENPLVSLECFIFL